MSVSILSNEGTAVLGYITDPIDEYKNKLDKECNQVFYKELENTVIYIDIDDSDNDICITIKTCPNTFPILEMI